MRIIVSVQSKRGSSRGLVHYIARSKIDVEREPTSGREIFNSFSDSLSVKSANNLLKSDISRKRPSNDELHHLVLSFRKNDFERFAANEEQRIRSAKEIARASMAKLEESLNADRLSWAAAIHLNTANPHIHIAIQKQYFTRDLNQSTLSRIPSNALPHYEEAAGKRQFVEGDMHKAATEKVEEIIQKGRSRQIPVPERTDRRDAEVSETLARWLVQKSELKQSDLAVESLLKTGDRRRFLITEPATGTRRRMSLHDLRRRVEISARRDCDSRGISDPHQIESSIKQSVEAAMDPRSPVVRQLRAILHKLVVKEEVKRMKLADGFKRVDRQVVRIRGAYRKNDLKLPTPSLTKEELDLLQTRILEANDLRGFAYLERVREGLVGSDRIAPRTKEDFAKLSAQRTVTALRARAIREDVRVSSEYRYSRTVEVDGQRWSIALLEKAEEDRSRVATRILATMGLVSSDREELITREQIFEKLAAEDRELSKAASAEQKKAKLLDGILKGIDDSPDFNLSIEQVALIEPLAVRLKDPELFQKCFVQQSELIRKSSVSTERKTAAVAGRALAREIVADVALQNTRDSLQRFSTGKRFHKFEIAERDGSVRFVGLNDVETHHSGSVLDRAVDLMFESREQKATRIIVQNLIKERDARLKDYVSKASEVSKVASKTADQFKTATLLGLQKQSKYQPIFLPSELAMIESRIGRSNDRREIKRLETIYQQATERPAESLGRLLREFLPTHEASRDRRSPGNEPIR